MLDRHAQRQPQAPAVVVLDERGLVTRCCYSYAELRQRARAAAGPLTEYAGAPVALVLESLADFAVAFLACLYAGAIPTPLAVPRRRNQARLNSILRQCRPAAILSDVPGLHWESTPVLRLTQSGTEVLPDPRPEDLALIQYSSGSTLEPRGVKVNHQRLLQNAAMMEEALNQKTGASLVGWLPLTHDMGLIGIFLQALYLGGRAILFQPSTFLTEPFTWLRAISDFQAQVSGGPDFAYKLCCQRIAAEQRASLDLSHWQVAFNGADMVRPTTLDAFTQTFADCGFRSQSFYPVYGLAEATLFVSGRATPRPVSRLRVDREQLAQGHVVPSPTGAEYVSCGQTWGGLQLQLLDPAGTPMGPGRIGAVHLQGPTVCPGYWRGAVWGPWLATGDLAFTWEGELYPVGRCVDRMVFHGQNHYPEDLEYTLQTRLPEVAEGGVCAIAVPAAEQDELLVALEIRGSTPPGLAERICAAVAEEHGLSVGRIVALKPGGLPKSTSGKLQRSQCCRLFLWGRWDDSVVFVNPGEIQRCLLDLLSPEIDLDTPFEALGLSSVERLTLVGDLAQRLNRSLAGDLTWQYPTLRALSQALALPVESSSALRGWRRGSGVPMIIVHGIGGDVFWAESLVKECPNLPVMVNERGEPLQYSSVEELGQHHAQLIAGQVEGPIHLLGYSYGCKYVFETARQLLLLGRQVDFLGLIDGYPTTRDDLPAQGLVMQLEAWLPQQQWATAHGPRAGAALALEGWACVEAVQAQRWRTAARALHPSAQGHVEAGQNYRPQPCPLHVHLFRSQGHQGSAIDQPGGGWADYALGGVSVTEVAGTHLEIIKYPHVVGLGQALNAALPET